MRTCGLCGFIGARVTVNEQGDPRCVNGPDVGCGGLPPLEIDDGDAPPPPPPPALALTGEVDTSGLNDAQLEELFMRWLEERTRPPGASS